MITSATDHAARVRVNLERIYGRCLSFESIERREFSTASRAFFAGEDSHRVVFVLVIRTDQEGGIRR